MSLGFFIKTAGGANDNNLAKIFKVTTGEGEQWYQLPDNTVPSINGRKIITMSQIVDGVAVFERISRVPFQVTLDFTVYQKKSVAETLGPYKGASKEMYLFPIDTLVSIFNATWLPGSAIKIDNILLGSLGILELIVEEITITPVIGSVNVNVSIRCQENYYRSDSLGNSLIIGNTEVADTAQVKPEINTPT